VNYVEVTYESIIRRAGPFHRNLLTELRKARKVYFVDPGLRNALLDDYNDLEKRADAGIVMENFVLNELSTSVRLHYWRTTSKAEVDFVSQGARLVIPIEVKFRRFDRPKVERSLRSFIHEYKPHASLVMTRDFWGERDVEETKVSFVPICYA